ncbi:MAG: diphthamide biosynthesis enzyme Dph2 [Candidatus Micrarchaeota archaeon]|nr:diphthamide biosynthesis enzyme Dph2 [Candidatus Micrarchaeota archaeon]
MRIMLQFPEGLKQKALEEAEKLEREGHEVFVSCSPCYGACDICLDEARAVGAEKIMHFGHAEFMQVKTDIQIEYLPYFSKISAKRARKMLKKAAEMLKKCGAKSVSLVYPIQHLHNSKMAKEELEAAGLRVLLGMGGKHVRHRGQILGCDSLAATRPKADAVVYFGGGKFHPTGIPSQKPVLCADPHIMDAYWITEEIKKAEKKRMGSLLLASKAKAFGILVSTKCGQANLGGARLAKKLLEKKGRKAAILVANELSPTSIQNFMLFGAYINTACPRINDDTEAYGKPIVNLADLKKLLELMV